MADDLDALAAELEQEGEAPAEEPADLDALAAELEQPGKDLPPEQPSRMARIADAVKTYGRRKAMGPFYSDDVPLTAALPFPFDFLAENVRDSFSGDPQIGKRGLEEGRGMVEGLKAVRDAYHQGRLGEVAKDAGTGMVEGMLDSAGKGYLVDPQRPVGSSLDALGGPGMAKALTAPARAGGRLTRYVGRGMNQPAKEMRRAALASKLRQKNALVNQAKRLQREGPDAGAMMQAENAAKAAKAALDEAKKAKAADPKMRFIDEARTDASFARQQFEDLKAMRRYSDEVQRATRAAWNAQKGAFDEMKLQQMLPDEARKYVRSLNEDALRTIRDHGLTPQIEVARRAMKQAQKKVHTGRRAATGERARYLRDERMAGRSKAVADKELASMRKQALDDFEKLYARDAEAFAKEAGLTRQELFKVQKWLDENPGNGLSGLVNKLAKPHYGDDFGDVGASMIGEGIGGMVAGQGGARAGQVAGPLLRAAVSKLLRASGGPLDWTGSKLEKLGGMPLTKADYARAAAAAAFDATSSADEPERELIRGRVGMR